MTSTTEQTPPLRRIARFLGDNPMIPLVVLLLVLVGLHVFSRLLLQRQRPRAPDKGGRVFILAHCLGARLEHLRPQVQLRVPQVWGVLFSSLDGRFSLDA